MWRQAKTLKDLRLKRRILWPESTKRTKIFDAMLQLAAPSLFVSLILRQMQRPSSFKQYFVV
jgi:hypothetical protein